MVAEEEAIVMVTGVGMIEVREEEGDHWKKNVKIRVRRKMRFENFRYGERVLKGISRHH